MSTKTGLYCSSRASVQAGLMSWLMSLPQTLFPSINAPNMLGWFLYLVRLDYVLVS
jgi:hypothetical protein